MPDYGDSTIACIQQASLYIPDFKQPAPAFFENNSDKE